MQTVQEYLERLFDYNHWANRQIHHALSEAVGSSTVTGSADLERAVKLFAHIAGAERVWYSRVLDRAPDPRGTFPQLDLAEADEFSLEADGEWQEFVSGCSGERLASVIHYVNSQGPQRNQLSDILIHIANHGTYHRGQINRLIRQSGGMPASIDFIVYARLHNQAYSG